MKKILILGHSRHGKDFVAEMISEYTGMDHASSSMAALDKIYPALQKVGNYTSKREAFLDRNNGNMPLLWRELITLYNTPDKAALARDVLENNDIYVGMRCPEEFEATKHMFDVIIWVDATGRVPIPFKGGSMGINTQMINTTQAKVVHIDNRGTKEETAAQIREVLVSIGCHANAEKGGTEGPPEPIETLIADWADSVFPDRTVTNAIQKLVLEEIPEYLMAQDDPMELADIGILVHDIAYLKGFDLNAAMREKMAINIERSWAVDPATGLMKHVKEGE